MDKGWRKEMKSQARCVLKRHYAVFVIVCLIAGFLGTEFGGVLTVWKSAGHPERSRVSDTVTQRVAMEIQIPGSQMITQAVFDRIYADIRTIRQEEAAAASATAAIGRQIAASGLRSTTDFLDKTAQILLKKTEEAKQKKQQLKQQWQEKENQILGRRRGVFASVVNSVTSGALLVAAASAVNSLVGSENIALAVLIVCAMLLYFAFWVFCTNMYTVISRRIFLEGRCYQKIPMQRFLFLLRIRRWGRVSGTMLVVSAYRLLWDLTIAGGIIKRYSYYMVPFIVAENPDISAREAITLSRNMMYGHKWECFLFELSFIGWDLLGIVTLRLSGVFFSYPYQVAAFGEYYAKLRELAIERKLPKSERLDDRYLFEVASQEILHIAYGDVVDMMEEEASLPKRKGLAGKVANTFGIVFARTKEEAEYEQWQDEYVRILLMRSAVEGRSYPVRLSMMPAGEKSMWVDKARYLRPYYVWNLVLMFFVFSFIGWAWEVSLHLIVEGDFVNRGVLHGPWLPIYGAGSILILVALNRLRRWPLAEFAAAIVLCGVVEYWTSWVLEKMNGGQRWWDYSGYFLNLDGRICAEGLLVFGIGGVAIVYVLAPVLDNVIRRIPVKLLAAVCVILLLAFGADQLYSAGHPNTGKGITSASCEEYGKIKYSVRGAACRIGTGRGRQADDFQKDRQAEEKQDTGDFNGSADEPYQGITSKVCVRSFKGHERAAV